MIATTGPNGSGQVPRMPGGGNGPDLRAAGRKELREFMTGSARSSGCRTRWPTGVLMSARAGGCWRGLRAGTQRDGDQDVALSGDAEAGQAGGRERRGGGVPRVRTDPTRHHAGRARPPCIAARGCPPPQVSRQPDVSADVMASVKVCPVFTVWVNRSSGPYVSRVPGGVPALTSRSVLPPGMTAATARAGQQGGVMRSAMGILPMPSSRTRAGRGEQPHGSGRTSCSMLNHARVH